MKNYSVNLEYFSIVIKNTRKGANKIGQMLPISTEGTYITRVFGKSIYANLKQASLFSEEANVVLLSVILRVVIGSDQEKQGAEFISEAEFSQLALIIMRVGMNTHVCFAFPLCLKWVQLDESKEEKNISIPVFIVL